VSAFSRTSRGPHEGGHYVQMKMLPTDFHIDVGDGLQPVARLERFSHRCRRRLQPVARPAWRPAATLMWKTPSGPPHDCPLLPSRL